MPLTEQEQAARQARHQFLVNQAQAFINQARALRVSLMLADLNQELTDELKEYLFGEFMQSAAICEVKK